MKLICNIAFLALFVNHSQAIRFIGTGENFTEISDVKRTMNSIKESEFQVDHRLHVDTNKVK